MKQMQQEDGGGGGEGDPMSPKLDDKKPEPEDDRWRAKFLLKEPMDFDMMEHKCQSNQYRIVEEFRADALLIVHNTVIYHGGHSNMADVARQMFRGMHFRKDNNKKFSKCIFHLIFFFRLHLRPKGDITVSRLLQICH